jgi:hypothetical protein
MLCLVGFIDNFLAEFGAMEVLLASFVEVFMGMRLLFLIDFLSIVFVNGASAVLC